VDPFKFHFGAMGSADNEVQLYAADRAAAQSQALLAIDEVLRIERKFSRYRPDSVVGRINASAGGDPVEVDEETAALLDYAHICHEQSGGLFDITSGVLRKAWDFKEHRVPSDEELQKLRSSVGWPRVVWQRPMLALSRGMEIDFGGFGKEYAADRSAAILRQAGVLHALINLGGDVRVLGPRADGTPWRIGVRHPRQEGAILASLPLAEGALATSGDYERFFEAGGKRYCHILDPRTGWPVQGLQSVSVVAPLCIVAGTWATLGMLEGDSAKSRLSQSGLAHLVVHADGSVSGTLR
jgi:thiamine biosynthesis lipoprotein